MLWAASVVVLAAATLAGGRSSIEHHDATLAQHGITRRRLSQTLDLRRLQHSSDTCPRPPLGCVNYDHNIYTHVDCDGDGILDHMCTTTINSNRWLVLSSEGCPQDWSGYDSSRAASECTPTPGNRQFVLGSGSRTRQDARVYCLANGMDLASIHSEAENQLAWDVCLSSGTDRCWIGGENTGDIAWSEAWFWSDGSAWDFNKWLAPCGDGRCGDERYLTLQNGWFSDRGAPLNLPFLCSDTPIGLFTFQAGRCYPQSEAPHFGCGTGSMDGSLVETGTPQECYDWCVDMYNFHDGIPYMGLDLSASWNGGPGHGCKIAKDDYNDWHVDCSPASPCKRPAGIGVAIEDMDWSWMNQDYVCFTEDFDADAEISELCDDVVSDAAGSSNDKDSDDNSLVVILCVVIGALLVGIAILAMMKRSKLAKRGPATVEAATSPTAPQQPALASIKAEALGMMSEEPIAEPIAEALPHGHVSGAEAAAMAAEEPPPQPSVGWGRRFASWRAVAEPPPPPEAEFEPEI